MNTEHLHIFAFNRDMRELIIVRMNPPALHYMVHPKPQAFDMNAFDGFKEDEAGLLATLHTIGYRKQVLNDDMIVRLMFAMSERARR